MTSMTDKEFNSAVTALPIGADMTSGSRDPGSGLKAISSLRPILKLMNIYSEGTEWHYENGRNMKWDVVLARTAEVGEITIDNTEEAIPPAAYMYIPRTGIPLFPNLAQLKLVNEPQHSSLYHLPLFISPRLHSLEIDNITQDDVPGLDCFLRHPDLQVSLTNVILGPFQYSPRILQAISQCKSVEIVTLTFLASKPVDDEAARLLGTTPKLQSLTIKADRVPYTLSYDCDASSDANFAGFAALKDICIIGVYSFIEAILTAVKADATIHTLNVTISSDWTIEDASNPFCRPPWYGGPRQPPRIDTLLSHVSKRWSSSLHDFILAVDFGTQGIISSHPALPQECISHLIKLSGLRRLVMSGFHLEGLDSFLRAEIYQISRSGGLLWPNIKEIQFPILTHPVNVWTSISLSTLCHLVQQCTNLVSFSGLIVPDSTKGLFEAFDKNPIQSGLKELSIGSSGAIEWNHDMLRTARFLEKLCPDLDKLTTHVEFSPTTWRNIFDAIIAFKEVRREGGAAVTSSLSAN